ncbi:MAG: hypothetical protein CMJ78_19530 [Planctomycetaceae bacterium]|nr:hypothetical protein [Planctomycetaceae bacterium]
MEPCLLRCFGLCCLLLSSLSAAAADQLIEFKDIAGNDHQPFKDKKTKAIVVVFISTDCPIANYYQPSLARLKRDYEKAGVQFFLVHPDKRLKQKDAAKHAKEFKITAPVVIDTKHQWVKQFKAQKTPEAILLSREGKVFYQGRVDNTFVDLGKKRRVGIQHDLKNALQAFVDGKPIKVARTKPIGCFISTRD